MLIITKKYRKDYTGEDIVVNRTYSDRSWIDTTESIPNAVTNNQLSNKAIVIGNGLSREKFDLRWLGGYSGLLGADTLQSYGCNGLYRDFTPDFLVALGNNGIVAEIAESGFTTDNIVYTNAPNLLANPTKFYLIPNDPYTDAGTTALYLAAFDGHKKIYMIGFEGQDTPGFNSNMYAGTNGYDSKNSLVYDTKWVEDKKILFNTYNDVDFVRVTERGRETVPESWKYCTNFRQISFLEFVTEADI